MHAVRPHALNAPGLFSIFFVLLFVLFYTTVAFYFATLHYFYILCPIGLKTPLLKFRNRAPNRYYWFRGFHRYRRPFGQCPRLRPPTPS
jgi:hypothetical protein